MCLYPKMIINPKYKRNKKNGWVAPILTDERVKYVPIGCQNCLECKRQKAREWRVRLSEHIKEHKNGKFITLTFTNENIKKLAEHEKCKKLKAYDLDNGIATLATRLWLERWRKHNKKSLHHWLITELGHNGTENIHLHGIIWTDKDLNEVEKTWQYGWIWKGKYKSKGKKNQQILINYVNEKTINYITKYVTKVDQIHKEYKSIILTSPGIGSNYITSTISNKNTNKYNETCTVETYRNRNGTKIALPIYYRNKLYNEKEKENLWIKKIEKKERWVDGNKIDISNGETEYYKALAEAQKKNTKLGYGNANKDWSRKQYEKERREIMQQKRINDA